MLFPISLYIFYWGTNRSIELKCKKIQKNHYFPILEILIKKSQPYIQVHLMWKGSIKISLTVNTSVPLLRAEFHQHSHAHVTARLNVRVNGITNPRKNKTYLFSFGVCLFLFHFFSPPPGALSQVWKKEKTLHTYSSHKIWIYESLRLKKQKYSRMLQYILLDLHAVSHTILQNLKGTQKYRWNKTVLQTYLPALEPIFQFTGNLPVPPRRLWRRHSQALHTGAWQKSERQWG